MKFGFGIDLGGTTVKIAYFDQLGNMLDKWEIPTVTADSGKQILPDIAASVTGYIAEKGIASEDILGLGIGVPGVWLALSFEMLVRAIVLRKRVRGDKWYRNHQLKSA